MVAAGGLAQQVFLLRDTSLKCTAETFAQGIDGKQFAIGRSQKVSNSLLKIEKLFQVSISNEINSFFLFEVWS